MSLVTVLFATNRGLYPMADSALGIYDILAESLRAQTLPTNEYEVICIDKDNTIPRRELTSFLGDRVRFFRPRETPWTRLGLFAAASARNTGLIHARGETVVAIDDCYEMSPRFLELVASHAAAGRYVVPVLHNGPDAAQRFGGPWRVPGTNDHPGGILAYPLATAIAINGYDERYDGSSCFEDIDFSARLERAGVRWVRDEAVVATCHALHAPRLAQPKCALLVWLLNEARRASGDAGSLEANLPWSDAELAAFGTCGRELNPPRCWRMVRHGPPVGEYGGQCDYDEELDFPPEIENETARMVRTSLRVEPETVRAIRTAYETRPWLDLATARRENGVDSPQTEDRA